MIRIYLDWNVISNFKRTEISKFQTIRGIISKNKNIFLIPFTSAHIDDLRHSVTSNSDHSLLLKDLDLLSKTTNNRFLNWTEKEITEPFIGHPNKFYYENIEDWKNPSTSDISNVFNDMINSFEETGLGSLGTKYKELLQSMPVDEVVNKDEFKTIFGIDSSINNQWDYLNAFANFMNEFQNNRDYYKQFRYKIQDSGISVPTNAGNWDATNVFDNLDKILSDKGAKQSFLELSEYANNEIKKGKQTLYDKFTSTYLMLDMFGYKSDKLKKPSNNFSNITTDAIHSFYGAHCDYLITDDKFLISKSKAIYSKFNIPTEIFTTEEFLNKYKTIIPKRYKTIADLINELNIFTNKNNIYEQVENEDKTFTTGYKLPYRVFDFFNYLIVRYYPEYDTTEFEFKLAFQTYSRFIFDNELEILLCYILKTIGIDCKFDLEKIKKEIFSNEEGVLIFNTGFIHLFLKRDNYKPLLVLYYNHTKANEILKK